MNDSLLTSPYGVLIFAASATCVVSLIVAIGAFLRWLGYGPKLKAIEQKFGPKRDRINRQISGGAFGVLNAAFRFSNRRR